MFSGELHQERKHNDKLYQAGKVRVRLCVQTQTSMYLKALGENLFHAFLLASGVASSHICMYIT